MKTNKTRKVENSYDNAEYLMERLFFRRIRNETIGSLEGEILEIGVGTGKNLKYYNRSAQVTGIDISSKMLEKAREKSDNINLRFELKKMDAQDLTFQSNTFDSIIGTFVFCSIPDPVMAMKEIKRVAKPNANIIFIEHVLSNNKVIAYLENLINPIVSSTFGFELNRNTKENIKNSGLTIEKDEELAFFDVFRRFTCTIY
ncbi:MAG: class I SAM-dependent methyltransferase [Candidatus Marinimicrobia bacterium]|nr:class I SAM-dependent methyltransferase [Candidatus Neomarinimicrobiota bacterium]